jgi:hypothetical protein
LNTSRHLEQLCRRCSTFAVVKNEESETENAALPAFRP